MSKAVASRKERSMAFNAYETFHGYALRIATSYALRAFFMSGGYKDE